MKVFIENHSFHYEIENLTRVFFLNEKIEIIKARADDEVNGAHIITGKESADDKIRLYCSLEINGEHYENERKLALNSPDD